MKNYIYISAIAAASLFNTSCDDFLSTVPKDSLSPEITWKTEADAEKFLIGCYSGWMDDITLNFYTDCGSDIGFNFHIHEGWRYIGNGNMTASNETASFYSFNKIRNCNDFLAHIAEVPFADETTKNDMIAQVKVIRAWQYFIMNWYYGGVPLIDSYETAEEAQVPRNTEEEVKKFIYDELDTAIPSLSAGTVDGGTINQGVALAIKMRSALYYGDYERAKQAALDIKKLGLYDLEDTTPDHSIKNYKKLFLTEGQGSKEVILAIQHDQNLISNWIIGALYNNADNGWSSSVPTQNLVNMYEMETGLTKEEAGNDYDPTHPFANRDPRMAATILYPGMDWKTLEGEPTIINTLDKTINGKENKNATGEDNVSKTGLSWAKYLGDGPTYYPDMFNANAHTIMFRYAEVMLTYAEAENELNGPSENVYKVLNRIRNRAEMPDVDRAKYNTQTTLRELIRRERTIELAGEGFRRADILRWKDESGKMLAFKVLNGPLTRITGTINYEETDPEKRAVIAPETEVIENRTFQEHNRYLPIPQDARDKNPKLEQNPGY